MTGHQLALELGPIPSVVELDERTTIELAVVVCQLCTGHHPVERCERRRVCPLCTGAHAAAEHTRLRRE